MTSTAVTAPARFILRAAKAGTGIIAGGPMRAVFETLGMATTWSPSRWGHCQPLQHGARHVRCAEEPDDSPRSVAARRGLKVSTSRLAVVQREEPPKSSRRVEGSGSMAKKATVTVEQIGSARSAARKDQRATLVGLGSTRCTSSLRTLEDTPSVRGMIASRPASRARRRSRSRTGRETR